MTLFCLFTLIYTMFTYNRIHLYYVKLQFNMDILYIYIYICVCMYYVYFIDMKIAIVFDALNTLL